MQGRDRMEKDDIRLTPISKGTVLDHLPSGTALKIMKFLKLENPKNAVTVAINTESKSSKTGRKDLVFIENRELTKEEYGKIGLIAKGSTVNIIKDKGVKEKINVEFPKNASGLFQCLNPKCITNYEGLKSKFTLKEEPLRAKCLYCEKTMNEQDVFKAIK